MRGARSCRAAPVLLSLTALAWLTLTGEAPAQGIGSQFPGVAPSVPSPGSGPPPPAIAPGPAGPIAPGMASPIAPGPASPSQMNQGGGSRLVQVPGLPPVLVPRGPRGRNSFHDRVERCVQYGTAAGVPSSEIGRFTRQCAN